MASRRRPSKSSTPLDDRQRKLMEEQEKLRAKMDQLNRMIEEAPKIKEAKVRARRDEILSDRATRAVHRLNSTTLADHRYDPISAPRRPRRGTLKAERRQARLIFCLWVILLGALVIFLLSYWHRLFGTM
ncbi:MAG TPA: hypothetical protein VHY22_08875 [Chthoniobacteraceae bacterium]|jgi:hypothetical protein|nr:hypothetical protein [Chthoniobacteraceae bacterium]